MASTPAVAFDGNTASFARNIPFGSCTVNIQIAHGASTSQGRARFSLNGAYPEGTALAGTIYGSQGYRSYYAYGSTITQSTIEACGFSNLDQVAISGPDTSVSYTTYYPSEAQGAEIWAIQDFIGFSFIGNDTSGVRSRYEFGISGTTGTIPVTSIIPVNAPPPEPVITSSASTVHRTTAFDVDVTFSRDVVGFDPVNEAGDFTISNATVTGVSGGQTSYTLTVVPSGAGDIVMSVPASIAEDFAGAQNTPSSQVTVIYDPEVVLTEITGMPGAVNAAPFDITVNFDMDVTGFDPIGTPADLTISNATVDAMIGGPSDYTLTLTPTGAGNISVSVPAGVAQTSSGNLNLASNVATATYDANIPSAEIINAPPALDGTNPFDVTVRFSVPVVFFNVNALNVTNALFQMPPLTNPFNPQTEFTVTITPDGNGDVTIVAPSGMAYNAVTFTPSSAAAPVTISEDAVPPTVVLASTLTEYVGTSAFTITATFAEDVTGFDDPASDVTISNGTITGITGGPDVYTIAVEPDGTGTVSVSAPADAAEDLAGNLSEASNTVDIALADTIPPVPTLSNAPSEYIDTTLFTLQVEFDEDVTGFDDLTNDLTITNGTVTSITGGPAIYTVEITPAGDGDITVSVPAAAAQDAALNDSTASTEVTITKADTIAPSVQITGAPDEFTHTTPFTVDVGFSEDVTGFDDLAADLTVVNGTATNVTGGPASYTVEVTPAGTGTVSITIPAAAAQDVAGNDNTASDTVTVGSTRVADTQKAISAFMTYRINELASNQVGLTHLQRDQGCGSFAASASEGSGSVSGCASSGNAWAALSGSWSDGQSYTLATFGAHSRISDTLLIGGMLQFDSAKQDENNASGEGWLAGPYFVAKAAGQPLFFEGRLLYGKTDNKISIYGGPSEDYRSERWLAQLQVSGEFMVEETKLVPLLDLTYTDDTQLTYTNAIGDLIPEQKVQLTQLTTGMEFSTPIEVASGALTLNGGLKGIYSSLNNATADYEGMRARVSAGGTYDLPSGGVLTGSAFYDGIGSDYESFGSSLKFSLEF
ncbi:Ig-like domain-containing protein [Halocynthiibacter styelae]|uniref:Autotransporter domain-containing protein n=1 Tax=Halocynthiibacter styelae TaxID=2761955 RepID=A0A8J7IPU9_9RHOB|nr:Ig-like domain-containing protein [Paenihalocynthiibacter styelae]MBI1493041.1 hypothetical protein [Paenihalocynthiibacter styelae]